MLTYVSVRIPRSICRVDMNLIHLNDLCKGIYPLFNILPFAKWVMVTLVVGSSTMIWAQESVDLDPNLLDGPRPEYLGVRPGVTTYAPGKKLKVEPGKQVITWVGFQAKGDRGRVFIQMNTTPIYEVASSRPDQVILDFPSARLHTRNDMNELDTGFFPTVVRSIQSRQVGKQLVRVVIKLREEARYRLNKDEQFLYLYFDPPKEPIDVLAEREREIEAMAPQEGNVAELKRKRVELNLAEENTAPSSIE